MSEQSESSEDSHIDVPGDEHAVEGVYETMNDRQRKKRKKRKLKLTPGKEEFLKKPNLVLY